MMCIFMQRDRRAELVNSLGSLNIYSVSTELERLVNHVSHMPLKLAAGELPQGGSLEPIEFYKAEAL